MIFFLTFHNDMKPRDTKRQVTTQQTNVKSYILIQ